MELANKFFSKLFGKKVGEDEFGNVFYKSNRLSRYYGRDMRWVIYNGIPEATKISANWHSWLHHQDNKVPTKNANITYKWMKPRMPNLSGSKLSYYPSGHFFSNDKVKPKSTGDYVAWKPN